MARNRETRFVRFAAKKIKCIIYKGSRCQLCMMNLVNAPWAAVFHHRDPADKSFAITAMLGDLSLLEIKKELEKCDLLCGHCHAKTHFSYDLFVRLKRTIMKRAAEIDFTDKYYVDDEAEKHILQLVAKGWSLKEIAEETGYCNKTLRKYIVAGVFGNDRVRKITNDELVAAKASGMSLREIALKYNMGYKTVWKRWRKLNEPGYPSHSC